MAERDEEKLRDLLAGIAVDDDALVALLGTLDITGIEFPVYDEDVAREVTYNECPECGHRWPR